MTTIKIETETITTDLTPSEAAAKIKEALGIAEWPQIGFEYWYVDDRGDVRRCNWFDANHDRYRQSHGNCSPTPEGLARYKAIVAKQAALWAIEQHRDKTFGVFVPKDDEERMYGKHYEGGWGWRITTSMFGGITVPFRTGADIERSFAECGDHWGVLK